MNGQHILLGGFLVGALAIPLFIMLLRLVRVELEDGEAALVTRMGKLAATLTRPGWHWVPDRILPWVRVIRVSTRRDFRHIQEICVNDARGTTIVVDVWLELRVIDPAKATFAIEDWDRSLRNLVSHAVISILGNLEFKQILCDRTELGKLLQQDISAETSRWGIQIECVFIRNVSLLPEVSQQLFQSVAARLERAKADIVEHGRQRVALLEADTSAQIAAMRAKAKGQYPAAVGRAYAALKNNHDVFEAYKELYELSLLQPSRMIAFKGFGENDLRSVDAAMLAPVIPESVSIHPIHAPLDGHRGGRGSSAMGGKTGGAFGPLPDQGSSS